MRKTKGLRGAQLNLLDVGRVQFLAVSGALALPGQKLESWTGCSKFNGSGLETKMGEVDE